MKHSSLEIRLQATDLDLSSDIKGYAEKKFGKLEQYLNPSDTSAIADIELARTTNAHQSGNIYRAEINLKYAGEYLRAESRSEDIFSAIDDTQAAIIREVRSKKNKKSSLFKKGARRMKEELKALR